MSGRKSSEVNSLLQRAELARKASEGNYLKIINNGSSEIKRNEEEINQINEKIQDGKIEISTLCRKEFPRESDAIEKQYRSLVSNQQISFSGKITDIKNKYNQVENDIKSADKESDAIRESIRGKSHYCTPEYKRADAVLHTYQRCTDEKNAIVNSINNLRIESGKKAAEMKKNLESYNVILKKYEELETKANKINELREKANEAKRFLYNQFHNISPKKAMDFMPGQYKEIEILVKKLDNLSDNEVVSQLNEMTEKIGVFSTELESLSTAHSIEKTKAESALNDCNKMLNENVYFDAMDYYNEGPNAHQYGLLEYIEKYAQNTSYVREINDLLNSANEVLKNELFVETQKYIEVQDILKKAQNKIESAVAYGILVQEKMLETTYTAADIRDVMQDFNYRVSMEMISDNPKDGWKVIAEYGDEKICFDKIYVSENDDVVIDIDHQISQGGSCGASWKKIVEAFENIGILVQRITMSNGMRVVDKTGKETATKKKDNQVIQKRK